MSEDIFEPNINTNACTHVYIIECIKFLSYLKQNTTGNHIGKKFPECPLFSETRYLLNNIVNKQFKNYNI